MERDNRFAALKNSATRVARFQQARHIEALNPAVQAPGAKGALTGPQFEHVKDGLCASLTTKWLREKLGSVRSPVLKKRDFVRKPSPDQAERAVRSAAHMQLLHHPAGRTDLRIMLKQSGIQTDRILDVRNEMTPPTKEELRDHPDSAKASAYLAHPSIELTFAQVCNNLKRGQGVVMRMSVRDTGARDDSATPGVDAASTSSAHVTGLYRSRLGKVVFFDPNAGAYKLNNPAEFIKSWKDAYAQRGLAVSMRNVQDGFFTCTTMKSD